MARLDKVLGKKVGKDRFVCHVFGIVTQKNCVPTICLIFLKNEGNNHDILSKHNTILLEDLAP